MSKKKPGKVLEMVPGGGSGGGDDGDGGGPERYSENLEFLGQSFAFYCRGMSCARIAAALKPEWPDVSERTVQRIAQAHGWAQSRAEFAELYTRAMTSAEGLVPEAVLHLTRMRTMLESRLKVLNPKEIQQYRGLVDDLLWLTGKHPKAKDQQPLAVSSEAEVKALLEAIAEDEILGPAWKRRRPQVDKKYREKLELMEAAQRKAGTARKGVKK